MRFSMALLPALAAGLLATDQVLAQSNWSGSAPVFASDAQRQADQAETQREARRQSRPPTKYPAFMKGGDRPDIKPAAPPIVHLDRPEAPGSIIIDTEGRKLYFVLPDKKAYEYPVSVGREGFTWSGTERISRIASWPSWTPPPEMRRRQPGLPITVSGGMINPQGARALYLGGTIYRIHGTNNERTIGRANSSGCFRMTNEHVVHLATIARIGARVTVLKRYQGGVSQTPALTSLFSFWSDAPAAPPAKAKPKRRVLKKAPTKKAAAPAVKQSAAAPAEKKAE